MQDLSSFQIISTTWKQKVSGRQCNFSKKLSLYTDMKFQKMLLTHCLHTKRVVIAA